MTGDRSQHAYEWSVVIGVGLYWVLQVYQATKSPAELSYAGPWGEFLLFLPIVTAVLAFTAFPALAIHLGMRGGWRDRGRVFWTAQVLCWSFPGLVGAVLVLGALATFLGLLHV